MRPFIFIIWINLSSFSRTIEYIKMGSKRLSDKGKRVEPKTLIICVIMAFEEMSLGICWTAVRTNSYGSTFLRNDLVIISNKDSMPVFTCKTVELLFVYFLLLGFILVNPLFLFINNNRKFYLWYSHIRTSLTYNFISSFVALASLKITAPSGRT